MAYEPSFGTLEIPEPDEDEQAAAADDSTDEASGDDAGDGADEASDSSEAKSPEKVKQHEPFRLAVLGDFSARANRGELESSDEIGERKPIKIDYESWEEVFEGLDLKLRLPFAGGASFVELEFDEPDAMHPDEIFRQVDVFEDLVDLRDKLQGGSFEETAQQILDWAGESDDGEPPPASRAVAVPQTDSLEELAEREGEPTVPEDADELGPKGLMQRLVGPHIEPLEEGEEPSREKLVAAVGEAIQAAMREILHHPDFQALESAWRGLAWLLKRAAKGGHVQVLAFDVSAEEFARDLAANEDLSESGVFKLLVEKTAEAPDGDPWTALVGLYTFDANPPHAEVLGRMGKLARRLNAPFLAAADLKRLEKEHAHLEGDAAEVWEQLRSLPEAPYVGLALPGFLLRQPYGEGTKPIEKFDFTEFSPREGTSGCLFASPSLACAGQMVGAYLREGWRFRPGKSLTDLEDMPIFVYRDEDEDEVPVTSQVRFTLQVARRVANLGMIPILAVRGRDAINVGNFRSLALEDPQLLGRWGKDDAAPPPQGGLGDPMAMGIQGSLDTANSPRSSSASVHRGGGGGSDDDEIVPLKKLLSDDDDDDDDDMFGGGGDDDDDDLFGGGGDSDDDDLFGGGDDDDTSDLFGGGDDDDDDLSSLLGGDDSSSDSDDDDDLSSLLGDDSASSEDGDDDDDDLSSLLADSDTDASDSNDDDDLSSLLDDTDTSDTEDEEDDDLSSLLGDDDAGGEDDVESLMADTDHDDTGDADDPLAGLIDDDEDTGSADDDLSGLLDDDSGDDDALADVAADDDSDPDASADDAAEENVDDDVASLMDDETEEAQAVDESMPAELEEVLNEAGEDALIDFRALLAPISADAPAGEPVSFEMREELTEMRREVNPASFPDDDPTRPEDAKKADWSGIEQRCIDALTGESKDLLLAARLTEALTKRHGTAGLRDGFRLLRLMVGACWSRMHPEVEDVDDMDLRAGPFEWLDDPNRGALFPTTVHQVPIVSDDDERAVTYLEWRRLQEGNASLTQPEFDRIIVAASREQAEAAVHNLDQARADLAALSQDLDEKMGDEAPSFSSLRPALEECLTLARQILEEKAPPITENGEGQESSAMVAVGPGQPVTAGNHPPTDPLAMRNHAYRQLKEAAAILQRLEPHSPIPYLVQKAVELGSMSFPDLMKRLIRDSSVLGELNRELGIQEEDREDEY